MPIQNNTSAIVPVRLNLPLLIISLAIFAALLVWCGISIFTPSNDWHHGFNHPLEGLDHIVVMLMVGVWAAQMRGNGTWLLPLTFVGNMSIGGLAGVLSLAVPGAEAMILLSGMVMCVLVIRRIRFATWMNLLLVAFFAFFHGYAHGQEIPVSASFTSYAAGFVLATVLLHGTGILIFRLVILSMTSSAGSGLYAQQLDRATTPRAASLPGSPILLSHASPVILQELLITGREDSQLGIADSASQGNIGQEQLRFRPISRLGEVLETVPGLIATQHSGEGKANQFFLRGFNLDHGTDFLTLIDGVPINQLSHAHGQGWTDTNFLIPELIETLEYRKGSHYAEYGDFSSAGAANIRYFNALPNKYFQVYRR
ncbi:MAG: HupE/UreJ family protein [Nitrosomonas sp.]|nr:HupE/UreJ family protein [Nitrosomonas sp.]